MNSLSTPSLIRKLARWLPNAHFSRTPEGELCLASPRWSRSVSSYPGSLQAQVMELLQYAGTQTCCPKLKKQAQHAMVILGRKVADRRNFEIEILDL